MHFQIIIASYFVLFLNLICIHVALQLFVDDEGAAGDMDYEMDEDGFEEEDGDEKEEVM